MSIYEDQIVSVTGSEPVSTTEVKEWALIDTSAEDALIGLMITTVRIKCESYLSRDIVAKDRKYLVERSEDGKIEIPWSPINAVSTVTYGTDNTAATLNSDYYLRGLEAKRVDFVSYPKDWVTITYSTLGLTDQNIKDAIKATFEALYNSRGIISLDELQMFDLPEYAKQLLLPSKKMFF